VRAQRLVAKVQQTAVPKADWLAVSRAASMAGETAARKVDAWDACLVDSLAVCSGV